MKKAFGFAVAGAALTAGMAAGGSLFDNPATTGNAVNQEFGDFPTYSTYLVDDVSFADPVNIDEIITFTTTGNGAWGTVSQARLSIFAKTGSLPGAGDDPTASAVVAATWNNGVLTASGLDIDLAAGDYWIGLTALTDFAVEGQEFHLGAAPVGDIAAYRNPGQGFAFPAGPDWGPVTDWAAITDLAMTINGTVVPAPGALALLGVAGLAARRRRRA